MGSGVLLTIGSLLFIVLLFIVYFKKSYLPSVENKVFRQIIVLNLIGVILHLVLYLLMIYIGTNDIITIITAKLYLVYLSSWMILFTLYVYIVSNKFKQKIVKRYKEIINVIYVIILISSVVLFVLPIEFHSEAGKMYTYGSGVNFIYIFSFILIAFDIVCLLVNINEVISKKYIPLLLYLSLGTVASFVQYQMPWLQLITSLETFVVFLMYFTIENPDIKMLEELHKAKEISDSSNEDKAMFLYNITSETRGIMRDIDAEADSILDETDNKKVNIENVNTSARNIKSSTARFTTMINEILDVSQIDSSNIKVYNEKYNVKLIIREIYSMYKGKCDKKGLEFRLNIASDVPEYLYGDSVGLKKVLVTVMDNAYSYTSKGYIELRVNVVKKSDVARLMIVVEDSGRGIKAEELDRIFEIRKNEKRDDDDDLDSNLYNARRLVTVIGGTIVPSSSLGKGTSIKIILDQKIAEEESNLKKYEKIYDKKNILLVDDNEASGRIFSKFFDDTDIVLSIVTSGKECLDKIRNKEKYDLILLDEEMSPLNGIEVMKKLKEIRNFNTKVVLLTRDNSYEYKDDYLDYGFVDYLLKPIDRDTLFQKLEKHLN